MDTNRNNKLSNIYCNNCNLMGHTYNNCKQPIVSLGIICYTIINGVIKYLMICRKDSLGFVDFVRGKYPIYENEYIQSLINEMSNKEKEILLKNKFDYIWNYLWRPALTLRYKGEDSGSKSKFEQIKRGIKKNNKLSFNLDDLIKNSTTSWKTPEWGFPKGRKNFKEPDLKCAFREFQEETGYKKEDVDLIINIAPQEEIFMGSNYKVYKHKYFIGKFNGNINNKQFQKTEVSDMKWLTYEECIENIRHYNIEKINLINNINDMLNKYRLIS